MWRVTHCGWCHSLGWDPELCKWGEQSSTKHFSLWFCGLYVMAASSSCLTFLLWYTALLGCERKSALCPLSCSISALVSGRWDTGVSCHAWFYLPVFVFVPIAVLSISLCCCTLYCWVAIFIYVYLNLFVHSHMNGLCVQFGLLLNCQFKDANKNAIFIVA